MTSNEVKAAIELCATTGEHPTTWDQTIPLLTVVYRGTLHKSTGFSLNFIIYGGKLFITIDVMMGQPDGVSSGDELDYVCGLRERLKDAYEVAREHLQRSAVWQKRCYDIRVNEKPYKTHEKP